MASKAAIHTLPNKSGGGWVNQREGSSRNIGSFTTKAEAQSAGGEMARRDKTEHVIHTRDGRISARNSYGSDPRAAGGRSQACPQSRHQST